MATQRSTSYLNALWITGYTPTQSDFQDLFVSFPNLSDNNALNLFETGITAHAGGGQGSAYQLTKRVSAVATVATLADSVKVPAATVGREGYIVNTGNNACDVFPQTGENWVNSAANAAISLPSGYTLNYYCTSAGSYWFQFISDTGQAQNICNIAASASTVDVFPSLWNTYQFTALAATLVINGPTFIFGTGQDLTFIIKDNGTSRTLTWNSVYTAVGGQLAASTVAGKTMVFKFKYNASIAKWMLVNTGVDGYFSGIKGVYRAIMTQTGTSAPVATILENSLGFTPTWVRDSAGQYYVDNTGKYVLNKTFVLCGIDQSSSGIICVTDTINDAPDLVYVKCYNTSFAGVDVNRFYVEISIYP
jgi:hypothetical protein